MRIVRVEAVRVDACISAPTSTRKPIQLPSVLEGPGEHLGCMTGTMAVIPRSGRLPLLAEEEEVAETAEQGMQGTMEVLAVEHLWIKRRVLGYQDRVSPVELDWHPVCIKAVVAAAQWALDQTRYQM